MKNNKLTPSEEDYVEMIYRINLNRGNVQVKDVANELNIKPASVTKMVKKLNDKDILEYKKYDYIKLTEMGYKVGNTLLKRHNTIYKFLEILGVKDSIHEETEKIERIYRICPVFYCNLIWSSCHNPNRHIWIQTTQFH